MTLRRERLRYRARRAWLAWAFSPLGACAGGLVRWAGALATRCFDRATAFRLLCSSHMHLMRGATGLVVGRFRASVEASLRRACTSDREIVPRHPSRFSLQASGTDRVGIVLKAPRREGGRVAERGVLLLKNDARIDAFRRRAPMTAVLESYTLVLEPSWSGYANPALLAFTRYREHPIVVMATCREDFAFLERLDLNLRPIAIGASDWVDPRIFHPLDGVEKDFDAVMIARWTFTKRHSVLLGALRRIADPSFRAAMVAMNTAQDVERTPLLEEIARSGVARQITIFEDLAPTQVNEVLNRSRVNLLLSLQEGSNRSIFEGFFAGVPGIALRRNLGIPLPYFTPDTGLLIDARDLASTLVSHRHRWGELDPRTWALAHIAPEHSTRKLGLVLRGLAAERGEPWTRDIVAKSNVPELRYYPDDSVGRDFPSVRDLLEAH